MGKVYKCRSREEVVVIPDKFTSIGDSAFTYNTNVKKVIIPETITHIGYRAFTNCKELTEIEIPSSVENIDTWAFALCRNLSKIIIPSSVKKIGASAFCCTAITEFTVPDCVETISANTFSGCKYLKKITLPDSIKTISNNAFYHCASLENIVLPKNLKTIGMESFSNCDSLKEVVIPESVETIEINAFSNCNNLEWIILYNSNIYMEDYTYFKYCKKFMGIKLKGRNSTFIFSNSEKSFVFLNLKNYQKIDAIRNKPDLYAFGAVYLFIEYKNETAEECLKKNIRDAVIYLTDVDDVQNLMNILHFIKKDDIDFLIKYAIQQQKTEIQVILSNYKNNTFGFSNSLDEFML